jgi:ADP-ribose pyrophosphatase YjhB (NUDIX family)
MSKMLMVYCAECKEPLEQETRTRSVCKNRHEYFNNPVAGASVALINEKQEILFAKRAQEPYKGKYDLPGGFLDFGENPSEAARRELQEEAGILLSDIRVLDITNNLYDENTSTVDIVFACHDWEGVISSHDDVESFEWHPLSFMRSEQFAFDKPYRRIYDALDKYLKELT